MKAINGLAISNCSRSRSGNRSRARRVCQIQRVCDSVILRLSLSLSLWAGSKNAPRAVLRRTMQKRGRQHGRGRRGQWVTVSLIDRGLQLQQQQQHQQDESVANNCQVGEFYGSTWRIINTLGQLPVAIRGIQKARGQLQLLLLMMIIVALSIVFVAVVAAFVFVNNCANLAIISWHWSICQHPSEILCAHYLCRE